MRILAERYASGEIGRDEFQQIRRDLIEQEALAHMAGDANSAATMDTMALVDTVTPNGTLLAAASAFVAGNRGTESSRILAGLIRALFLDTSVFHFDLLERLAPEQRAWAEGLIKAKLERLIPFNEWDRAYDIVRNFEHQTESTDPADHRTTGSGDWDSMLDEAERFLNSGKSKAAPARKQEEPGDATPAADPPGVPPAVNAPAPPEGSSIVVKLHEMNLADPPVPYAPATAIAAFDALAYTPAPPPKRKLTRLHGVAGLAALVIAAIVFNAMRPKPASPPVVAGAATSVIPAPAVNAADGRQQSKGQILAPLAGDVRSQTAAVAEMPDAKAEKADVKTEKTGSQADGADKPIPAQAPSGAQSAVAAVTADAIPPAVSAAAPTVVTALAPEPKAAPSQTMKAVTAAPASRKPIQIAAKMVPAKPSSARAATGNATPAPATKASPAQTIAKAAETAAAAADPIKSPVQVAAVTPALRAAPEIRPVPRPDDIEAWSGGEDSLQQGMRSFQSGNYKDAVENLQKALDAGLRVKRNTVTAHKLLALSHCALGRESQCRQEFQQALRIDPSLTLGADDAAVPSAGAAFGSARSAQGK